jgi:hypothetical protein
MDPLNPFLYRLLKDRFGDVRVAKPGMAFKGEYKVKANGREGLDVEDWGETYAINCPKCSDTKFHCSVSHAWGNRDSRGRLNLFLLVCFRGSCNGWQTYDERKSFFDALQSGVTDGSSLTTATISAGHVDFQKKRVFVMPGETIPLHDLEADHPANVYLSSRGFVTDRLSKFYHLHYCLSSKYRLARDRIIIPVEDGGEIRGWQARYIGDLDWKAKNTPPKYFTVPGMRRSRLLYNFDKAKQYKTLVLCEGPSDVWAFGPMAACIFGSHVTGTQALRIEKAFADYSVVLLLDPEAMSSDHVTRLTDDWKQGKFDGGFAPVVLPAGEDPGSLSREVLRRYVRDNARPHGVEVSYKKRKVHGRSKSKAT